MVKDVLNDMKSKMNKTIEYIRQQYATVHTGRASVSLIDGLKIDYYGTLTPLNQIASISVPESSLIVIQPWDVNAMENIEKAILKSDLGLNPANDGKLIRLPVPKLSEERRKELVKVVKRIAEEGKVSVRNERREARDKLKSLENQGAVPEDESRKAQDQAQKATDEYIKKIDELLGSKEKEILSI